MEEKKEMRLMNTKDIGLTREEQKEAYKFRQRKYLEEPTHFCTKFLKKVHNGE